MPFLWEFPPRVPDKRIIDAVELPCSAASALCPAGVARVSRLIGKSDTTAKCSGWQVDFGQTGLRNLHLLDQIGTGRRKRHSNWSGVSLSCAGHWPPKQLRTMVIFIAPSAGLFRPVSPFEGPLLWRWLLPDPAVLWAGRDSFQQPVHHWHSLHSNSWTVCLPSCFQSLEHP